MNTQKIKECINFLQTIPEEGFCKGEQTLGFDIENIGKVHCAIGWLAVAPGTPLRNIPIGSQERQIDPYNLFKEYGIEAICAGPMDGNIGLAKVNNEAPHGQIKDTVVSYLKSFLP